MAVLQSPPIFFYAHYRAKSLLIEKDQKILFPINTSYLSVMLLSIRYIHIADAIS